MRNFLVLLLGVVMILLPESLFGQTIKVLSVEKQSAPIAADVNVPASKLGVPCALLRFSIPGLSDVTFDNTYIVESYFDGNVYNVYVAEGMKRIIVKHPEYLGLTVDFSKYGLDVVSRNIYDIKLECDGNLREHTVQTLGIMVAPADAVVIVESINSGVKTTKTLNDEAEYRELVLPLGEYKYTALAAGHYQVEGTFKLTDEQQKLLPIKMVAKATGRMEELEHPVQIVYQPVAETKPVKKETKTVIAADAPKFYIEPTLMTIDYMGAGVNMGVLVNRWNAEAGVMWSMTASELISWKNQMGSEMGAYTYKPVIFNAKVGYSVVDTESFVVTPQLGLSFLKCKATHVRGDANLIADGSNALGLVLDCKLAYRMTNRFGLFLTPQYAVRVARSDSYPILAYASSKMNHWNNSFGLNLGFTFILY